MSGSGCLVCGVDGSDGSFRAAAVAVELADRLGARLVFVHVLPSRAAGRAADPLHRVAAPAIAGLRGPDPARAHAALASVGPLLGARPTERIVERGDAAARLAAVAAVEDARLIVVGCLGTGRDGRGFLGSVSGSLAAQATTPVVVVPDAVPPRMDRYEWGVGTVVCGVDGSSCALAAATAARGVVTALDTTRTLACVDDPSTRALGGARAADIVQAAAEAVAPLTRVDMVTPVGNAARQLAHVAKERDAAMIAVGSRGRGSAAAEGRPLGSIATIVSGLAECPVLIAPRGVDGGMRTAPPPAEGFREQGHEPG